MSTYLLQVAMRFSAAHRLRNYNGKCARIHGHNYCVKAAIEVSMLNEIGISIDYFEVKQIMRHFVDQLDHQYINEIQPFDSINPTAETIAQWFYQQLKPKFSSSGTHLKGITLWENNDFSVYYSEK